MVDERVGSIRVVNNNTEDNSAYFFAYDDHYSFKIANSYTHRLSRNPAALEEQFQKVELKFHQFEKALKKIGYLDDTDPILTMPRLYKNAPYMYFKIDAKNVLLKFDLRTGKISSHWHKFFKPSILEEQENVINHLRSLRENVVTEITNQGYKVENKHINTLLCLHLRKTTSNLFIGDFKDWIPYVYAEIHIDKLFEILTSWNNPGYYTTGKMDISVETAKKLGSIHSSFAEQILQ